MQPLHINLRQIIPHCISSPQISLFNGNLHIFKKLADLKCKRETQPVMCRGWRWWSWGHRSCSVWWGPRWWRSPAGFLLERPRAAAESGSKQTAPAGRERDEQSGGELLVRASAKSIFSAMCQRRICFDGRNCASCVSPFKKKSNMT